MTSSSSSLRSLSSHGALLFHIGQGRDGIKLLEEANADYDRARLRNLSLQVMGYDVDAVILEWIGLTYGSLGYIEKSRAAQANALELARRGGHPFTIGQESAWSAYGFYYLRDHDKASEVAEVACKYCEEQNVPFWLHAALITRGFERVRNTGTNSGLSDIHRALEFTTAVGSDFVSSWARIVLADAYLLLGDLDAADEIISQAKTNIYMGFDAAALSTVLNIEAKIDISRRQEKATKAEGLLLDGLRIAREHQYRTDELRTSVELARLWNSRGLRQQAFELLAPIFGWFTEGFDAQDLKEAKELLRQLQ